jgi:DNA ligase-1
MQMHNSDDVMDAINAIAAIRGHAKQKLIEKCVHNQIFLEVCTWALDPMITFGVKQIPKATKPGYRGFSASTHILLSGLKTRQLTGKKAKEHIVEELDRLTTPSQELLRRILAKNLKAGFSASSINRARPGSIDVFNVMRAQKFREDKITYPCHVETKLDGIRALVFVSAAGATIRSRGGHKLGNYPHIEKIFDDLYAKSGIQAPIVIDGEIVSGDFGTTTGNRAKKDFNDLDASFHAFDIVTERVFYRETTGEGYVSRRQDLEDFLALNTEKAVTIMPNWVASSLEDVYGLYDLCRANGHEGIIVKSNDGFYVPKKSWAWMKIKPEETVDIPIIGYKSGDENGGRAGLFGSFICDYNGVEVDVSSGLTDDILDSVDMEDTAYFGKIIEVRYHEETPDGSLRHPVFVRFREDKVPEDGA